MSTPKQVAANLKKRMTRVKEALRQAEGDTLRTAKRQARSLASGPYSTATLRKMGHPYRHGGSPPMDPGIINVQRDVFRRGWNSRLGSYRGDVLLSRLSNGTDVAKYMRGTSRMVPRPIWKLIGKTIRPVRRSKLKTALRRALHG